MSWLSRSDGVETCSRRYTPERAKSPGAALAPDRDPERWAQREAVSGVDGPSLHTGDWYAGNGAQS